MNLKVTRLQSAGIIRDGVPIYSKKSIGASVISDFTLMEGLTESFDQDKVNDMHIIGKIHCREEFTETIQTLLCC